LNFLDQYKIIGVCTMQRAQLAPLLFLAFFGFAAHASEPIVHTQYGYVRGVSEGQVESFKGLPFAAPPVRWKQPEDPQGWGGTRDASHFSSQCQQERYQPHIEYIGNEDCLYLNVFRPTAEQPGAELLPVIVFIHGGSLVSGSASETSPNLVAVYDGSRLAEAAQVVVVTLNYRLGPFGFLSHKKLSAESGHGSGNYGYLDQIKALNWVQNNIGYFGGDKNNVTLFGQSAGATSVWVHISSPLSKGLFHRAIVDSGVEDEAEPLEKAQGRGAFLSERLHCSNQKDELACMRNKPVKEIFGVRPSFENKDQFGPVVDNYVLTESPIATMRRGTHNHVPIIQGNNEEEVSGGNNVSENIADDLSFATAVNGLVTDLDFQRHFPGASLPDLINLYRVGDPDGYRDADGYRKAYNAIQSDSKYICTSRRVLTALSKSQPEFFVGRFFYTHTYSDGPNVFSGAAHGFELPFIFDTLSAQQFLPTADEAALVKVFQETWGMFAKKGVPPQPSWKRYNPKKDNYLKFDTPTISTGSLLHKQQCDYWDTLPSTSD
jgi:para-nitrobenzyl esterase